MRLVIFRVILIFKLENVFFKECDLIVLEFLNTYWAVLATFCELQVIAK